MAYKFADLVLEFEFDEAPTSEDELDEYETKLATRQEELLQIINAALAAENASVSC